MRMRMRMHSEERPRSEFTGTPLPMTGGGVNEIAE